ncbi:riboflavin synthase [Effusibacillus lacus]|uniref:Riboflavin synthase n=1 Tax=Effusibacillus lacus TaxID=1348429 RepID=A0A292YPH7_9BACL|nr:riboflavin synthase [Effusibacillus lacus]TCS76302.1 riboflavin synthase alpha chain [Effusibacillus lacus]GAX91848.1 riboflavin synthase [Effusibacillus lacus]
MFTGIIEEVGRVASVRPSGNAIHLKIQAKKVVQDAHLGDSIAVNGVCLTVTRFDENGFEADVVPETMRRTALRVLQPGSPVNLERAMQMGGRFGGHIVSGHIDGVGTIRSIAREDNARVIRIEAGPDLLRYIVPKGSIAIDGVSLTVMDREENSFRVSIIPHTANETNLIGKETGDPVNLECDMIGKYVERLLEARFGFAGEPHPANKQGLSMEFLRQHGFAD